MDSKRSWLLGATVAGVAAIVASGCGDSSGDVGGSAGTPPPPAATDKSVIPASAGASGTSFVSYVMSMSAEEVATEPNTFEAGFTDPAEDGDEPVPAS